MSFKQGMIPFLALLLVVVPFFGVHPDEVQAATSRVAIIKELTGTVQVQKSGGSKQFKAFARMSLNEGDVLTTGSSSTAVLQFANGSSEDDRLTVSANTTLTFSKLSDRDGTRTKISMFNGTAWVDVKSITTKKDEFTLETPTAVMGVRGTHLLVNVDPATGSTRLSVAAGIVSTSTAGSTEPRNVLPNQDALLTQGDGDVTIAPTDLKMLMAQADNSIIEAIIKAAGDIVKENEEKKSQYVEQSGLQSPEDQARLKSNVENLLGAIVDTAVKSGLISEDRANQLVKESQSQAGVTIDLSKKEITLSDEEKLQQEQQKKKDEDAKKIAEEQKKQQNEERMKNDELLKKLDENRKKKEEANKQALEDMKAKNEADYLKQLDDAAQQRFQGDQKNLGQEQQSSPSPTPAPTSTSTQSPTTYYTVSFNSNGGSSVTSISIAENALVTDLAAPTKVGYTFEGWYSDSGLTQSFSLATPITADTTLYAKWNNNSYKVSFDSNGGSSVADQAVLYNGTATLPATAPTKIGYTFAGWYSDSGLTTVFLFTTPITADTTLYAKWNINSYTVSFDSNGGSSIASQTVDYNTNASEPTEPTKTGYTFAGWYSDSGLTTDFSFTTTPITVDTTLYAKWNINSYTVSFDSNGGSSVADQTVNENGTASQPSDPTKEGFVFDSWYEDSGLTLPFSFTTLITDNMTLYAKWIPTGPLVNLALYATADASDSYSGYDPRAVNDGAIGTDWAISGSTAVKWIQLSWVDPQRISHIKLYDRVHIPDQILSGTLTFSDGTSIEVGSLPNDGTIPGEFIFPAKTVSWVKLTINSFTANPGLTEFEAYDDIYTVSFNSNGGSAVASRLVNYNGTVTPQPSEPTLAGYEFAGWYNDSDLTQPFEFQSTPITGNVTLYAKWNLVLNVFVNEGFESPFLEDFLYVPAAPGWTFTGNYSGIAPNKSGFGNIDAPEGTQAAILQMNSSFSQTLTFSAGTFNISFYAVQRGGNQQNFDVYVDSALIGNFTPASSAYNVYTTDIFTVPAGPHTVKFLGKTSTSSDNTVFIDRIKLYEASASSVAMGITSITPPAPGATDLTLPIVPSGYTITIYSSSNTGVIGTNGAIAPPTTAATVDLVFRITRMSDNSTADTETITVTVLAGQS